MKSFFFLPFFLLPVFFNAEAQSPGGIAAGNTMWLRSDVGLTSTANIVSQWQELSGANVTGNFTVQSLTGTVTTQTGPTVIDAGINFNPYLSFDGFANSLSSINLFQGTSLVSNSNVTVFQVLNLRGGIVWLKWETDQVGSIGRLGFENSGGTIRFDFPKAVPATAGQNVGVTSILNIHTLSTAYANATTSVNRLNGADDNTIAIPGPGDFTASTDKIVIGNENLINLPAQVDIAELIIYSSTLSAADRNRVESYLAVKYGFTLNQAAANANDYTSSNGTVTWNRAANAGYADNITGIGRDDASGLSQKQSKSINAAALVTLYNGTYAAGNFPLLNANNTNSFASDVSFLLAGDNAGATTIDQCIFNGKAQRMQRVWKVNKTGPLFPATVSVDAGTIPAAAKNIIVSANPAFPPGSTVLYPLTVANGKVYADISFNNNEYFTYSTDTLVVSMVPTQPLCSNPASGNVATTVTGGNPPLTYSWSPSGQNTANLVNVVGGTYTLTITQGTCQATQQVTLTSPASPAAPLANSVFVCSGNSSTLTVLSPVAGLTYNWFATATGGTALGSGTSYTTPAIVANTSYYVEAVSGVCVSIRTAVSATLTIAAAPVANGATICAGNTATLTVQNPNGIYTYNWYAAATGGAVLATGTSFTTTALNTGTTYYVESVNAGCSSTRTAVVVNVTTVPEPSADAVALCPGNTAVLEVQTPAAYTYNWYAAATGGVSQGTGTVFTTGIITAALTMYVEASDGVCSSPRTAVQVSLLPPLDSPKVTVTNVSSSSISFSWPAVAGALGYQVAVDGAAYVIPSSGSMGLTHTVSSLPHSQTVTISVKAISPPQGCGDSNAGHAAGTTFGDGFYVPAAFTPNGDSRNDLLIPILPGGTTLEYFTIYNRYGQRIFTTSKSGAGWDGKWQGQDQPIGTFVWICRYRFGTGRSLDEKGTFMILH